SADEKINLFRKILVESQLLDTIRQRSELCRKSIAELRIAIKPTFMLGYHTKDRSPITDPALVEDLVCYLKEEGYKQIAVVEGPNIYDAFYKHRSVGEVAKYFSFTSSNYNLVDVSAEQVPHTFQRGLAQSTVSRTWKDADFRISFAKMRTHPIELAYLTI